MRENTLVKYTMTYGLYLGIAFSIVVVLLKLGGGIHHPGDTAGMINAMLLSLGIFVFGKKYRDTIHEGEFLYKNALGFAVLLTVFSAIIYTFFSYWYYAIMEPSSISYYIEQMRLAYTQNGTFSDDQIETLVQLYNTTLTPGMMAFITFFSQVLIGVLLGLVISVFIKTPNRLGQNNY
jgi:hypothetical protein